MWFYTQNFLQPFFYIALRYIFYFIFIQKWDYYMPLPMIIPCLSKIINIYFKILFKIICFSYTQKCDERQCNFSLLQQNSHFFLSTNKAELNVTMLKQMILKQMRRNKADTHPFRKSRYEQNWIHCTQNEKRVKRRAATSCCKS